MLLVFSKEVFTFLIIKFQSSIFRVPLPNPKGLRNANALDNYIYQQRTAALKSMCEGAKNLIDNCRNINDALDTIADYIEHLGNIAYEVSKCCEFVPMCSS